MRRRLWSRLAISDLRELVVGLRYSVDLGRWKKWDTLACELYDTLAVLPFLDSIKVVRTEKKPDIYGDLAKSITWTDSSQIATSDVHRVFAENRGSEGIAAVRIVLVDMSLDGHLQAFRRLHPASLILLVTHAMHVP